MNSRPMVYLGVALLAGMLCGIVDVGTTEVSSTIVALLFCGFVNGAARPARFALSAMIIGICVPVVRETALLIGITSAESDHTGGTIGMLAVGALSALLAMLGAGAGAALVRAIGTVSRR